MIANFFIYKNYIALFFSSITSSYQFFLCYVTPLIFVHLAVEEITSCSNKAAKGANKTPRNPPSYFSISYFTASVTLSINISSNDFMILKISFIPSLEINEVNPFPALTAILKKFFFFFKIFWLHLKLSYILIQLNYLLIKEYHGLLMLFFLDSLSRTKRSMWLNYFR